MDSNIAYLKKGEKLGKYTIQQIVGRGGMSEVYQAYNPDLDHHVAIKILHPVLTESANFTERFRQEARSAARLAHPNIVRIYDFALHGQLHYMVMELVDGQTLREVLHNYPTGMPPELIIRLFEQIGAALHFAHANGVLHRDIKPANIIISEQRAVLTDFGLAKIVNSKYITATQNSTGTPIYMSPEQALGKGVGFQSDIYSLGILLYEMVTGNPPFLSDTSTNVILQHISEAPVPPQVIRPDIDPSFDYVIMRALEKIPQDRFLTVAEMMTRLTGKDYGFKDLLHHTEADTLTLSSDDQPTTKPPIISASAVESPYPPPTHRLRSFLIGLPLLALLLALAGLIGYRLADQDDKSATENNAVADNLVENEVPTVAVVPTNAPPPLPTATPAPPAPPGGMVYIPASNFTMGSAEGEENEEPPHLVELAPFFMDRYEVTNHDYYEFLEETGYTFEPSAWNKSTEGTWQLESDQAYAVGSPDDLGAFDGVNITALNDVYLNVNVNTIDDTGYIIVRFKGRIQTQDNKTLTGNIRIELTVTKQREAYREGGVADNVLLYGDTERDFPLFPRLVAPLAIWGVAQVYVDNRLVYDNIQGHLAVANGVRDGEMRILRADHTCCFSSANPSDGTVEPRSRQIMLILWETKPTARSPQLDFQAGEKPKTWVHLYFRNVKINRQPDTIIPEYNVAAADRPVTGISWDDAQAYCVWRGKRLPTEAEWEYASKGADGRVFPWGNQHANAGYIPANINFARSMDVGTYADGASPFGIYDMAGNVWEWVADWYGRNYYTNSAAVNPQGPAEGRLRVVRGGGYQPRNPEASLEYRSTYRLALAPDTRAEDIGFRCAGDVPTQ